jgi:hypothetical protein
VALLMLASSLARPEAEALLLAGPSIVKVLRRALEKTKSAAGQGPKKR